MKTIQPHALGAILVNDPSTPILDVRSPGEFATARLPSSFNVPLDELDPVALKESGRVPQGRTVYLMCQSGPRANRAADLLGKAGFDNLIVVDGGLSAWERAGLPLERTGVKRISLERQVRIAAGALVLTGVLLGWHVHPGFIGLSGFVGAGLVFAGITDFCGMGLLLARLPYNKRA